MTAQPEHDREEERMAALLRSVADDAPPPDRRRLAALRELSLNAFVASAAAAESASPPSPQPPRSAALQKRRSPMLTLAIRGLAAAALTAVAAVGLFNLDHPKAVSGAPFSDVLAELRTAKTLQLRVVKNGRAAEVSIRAGPGPLPRIAATISHRHRLAAVADRRIDQYGDDRRFSLVPEPAGASRSLGSARNRCHR